MSGGRIIPKHEPEIMRARGRSQVAKANAAIRKPYGNLPLALEYAELAYGAHGLAYEPGSSRMPLYPPDRFAWFCDEAAPIESYVKIRDNQTGLNVVSPWWTQPWTQTQQNEP